MGAGTQPYRGSLELVLEGACTGDLHVEDGRVGAAVHVETDELPQLLIGDAALVRQEGPARRHHSSTRALRRDDVELERICLKKKNHSSF